MVQPATLIRFRDRRSAYRFVSEIRRRYDLDRLVNIRVQPTLDDEAVVEMPSEGYSIEVADVAERHGGVEPTNPGEMDRLRAAMAEARQTQREARRRIGRAQDAMEQAVDAIRRRRDNQGNEPN